MCNDAHVHASVREAYLFDYLPARFLPSRGFNTGILERALLLDCWNYLQKTICFKSTGPFRVAQRVFLLP